MSYLFGNPSKYQESNIYHNCFNKRIARFEHYLIFLLGDLFQFTLFKLLFIRNGIRKEGKCTQTRTGLAHFFKKVEK